MPAVGSCGADSELVGDVSPVLRPIPVPEASLCGVAVATGGAAGSDDPGLADLQTGQAATGSMIC